MADGGLSPGSSQSAVSEDREAQIQALMDPAALETRLAEARVRRTKLLAERARAAEEERPAPPRDLPPEALRPLVDDDARGLPSSVARSSKRNIVEGDDAPGSVAPRSVPHGVAPEAPPRVLRLVRAPQSRPQPVPATEGADPVQESATPALPPRMPRRRIAPLLLALLTGAVIGLASAALVPGIGGWQIVIIRPAADDEVAAAVTTRGAAPDAAARGSDVVAVGQGEAAVVGAEAPAAVAAREAVPNAALPRSDVVAVGEGGAAVIGDEAPSAVATREAVPDAAVRGSDVVGIGQGEAAGVGAQAPSVVTERGAAPDAAVRGSDVVAVGQGEAAVVGAEAPSTVTAREAIPNAALPRSDVVAVGEGEAVAAGVGVVAPPVFGGLAIGRVAATPGRFPPPPELAALTPEVLAEAAAQPEFPRAVEHAGGVRPRIEGPGAPPRVRMRVIAASLVPKSHPARVPTATVTPVRLEPAWQVPELDVPALPRSGRALPKLPAPPTSPVVSQPALSGATRAASIVLHHPPDAAEEAEAARAALAAAGADDLGVRKVVVSISSPNVRYYHEEDRRAAGEVADLLTAALAGDDVVARDFTGYVPAPDPGLIEIWIAGSAPAAARVASSRADPARAARERLVRSIEERLRERLR